MANSKHKKFSGEKVYQFCKSRWNFYEKQDGAYLPSKHDKQVFEDASKEFGITESACEYWFNKIDKPLAEKLVKDAIKNGKLEKMCDDIFVNNGESPWGLEKMLKQFYSIIYEIKSKGVKRVYVTVAKNDKKYCSSGHYLTEIGFSNNISICQYENGDIGLSDDSNSGYVFELGSIKSIMCDITDSDNDFVLAKKMFRLLMKNGNIVTMYFDFKKE